MSDTPTQRDGQADSDSLANFTTESFRQQLAAVTRERDAIRVCFAEASHNDCQAGHEIKSLKAELTAAQAQVAALRSALGSVPHTAPHSDWCDGLFCKCWHSTVAAALSAPPPPVVPQAQYDALRSAIQTQIIDSPRLNELAAEDPTGRAAEILSHFKQLLNQTPTDETHS